MLGRLFSFPQDLLSPGWTGCRGSLDGSVGVQSAILEQWGTVSIMLKGAPSIPGVRTIDQA